MRAEWTLSELPSSAPLLFAFENDRMAGEHAALMQAFLAAHLGLNIDEHVDGWWGPASMQDLLLPFQRRYFSGSDIDGIAGPQVYRKITELFVDKPVRSVKGVYTTYRMPSIRGGFTNFTFANKVGRQGKWRIPTYGKDAPRRCGYRNLNREDRGGDAGILEPGDVGTSGETAANSPMLRTPTSSTGANYSGGMSVCPVSGDVYLGVDWLAPRSGGRLHQGNDIFASTGTPVVAPASGWAWFVQNAGIEGNSFRINSDDGSHYYFGGHLDSIVDPTARRVTAGEQIGTVGQTGNAFNTPPHLHFEVGPEGKFGPRINPRPLLDNICQS